MERDDCDAASTCTGAPPDSDAMLQAVLTFLDDHDASESFGETSSESAAASSTGDAHDDDTSSDSGSSPKSASSMTSTKTENTARPTKAQQQPHNTVGKQRSDKRQRDEMIALREESLALQDRVEELKRQVISDVHASEDDRPHKKRATDESQGERKDALRRLRAQAWQAMTEVQQQRREAAETERERLRELIDQQKKSFRQLRRYLVRHAEKHKEFREIAPTSLFHEDEEDTSTETSSEPDDADFDELSRAIPTMLLQTGGLFQDTRLDTVMTTLRDLKVQNEESHKMTIEALDSRVVPFDVATTATAVWQHHLTKAHRAVECPDKPETLEITDTCIRRAFRAAIDMRGQITRARGRMETRRYVEQDRVVIVQSSILDRIEFSSVPLPNFAIRHFQWTVIEPPRNAMLRTSGKALSQVEIFGVNVPTITDMDEAGFRDAIKRGCVEAVSLQLEFERQSVENILMERLVQRANVDPTMLHVPQW